MVMFVVVQLKLTRQFIFQVDQRRFNFRCENDFLGCGDYKLNNISVLPDPCALPGDRSTKTKQARRVLNEKERLLYAPFSGVGGIVYDKDAVYIELGGSHSHRPSTNNEKVKLRK